VPVCRSLVCNLAAPLPAPILALLSDFRLMVNRGVREALEKGLTVQGSLTKFSQGLARELRLNGAHARTATETALSLDAGHRRRLRKGTRAHIPYVRTPFLVADDKTFHLNPDTGHLRLSLRNSEWAGFDLRLSDWHRSVLATRRIKQLRLNANRAVLVLEVDTSEAYSPRAVLALDTNERSLDGVLLESDTTTRSSSPSRTSQRSNTATSPAVASSAERRRTTGGSVGGSSVERGGESIGGSFSDSTSSRRCSSPRRGPGAQPLPSRTFAFLGAAGAGAECAGASLPGPGGSSIANSNTRPRSRESPSSK
jgi:hypothetical protein